MKNVTIVVDEEVARWARVAAARNDTSVSRMVGEMLRERMESERRYAASEEAFNAVTSRRLRADGEALPAREELHERGVR